jgi:hypothetical protein
VKVGNHIAVASSVAVERQRERLEEEEEEEKERKWIREKDESQPDDPKT